MKKFRLIREYPSSPELGEICILSDNNYEYYCKNNFHHKVNNPENYPEFWEPVSEKDYEILKTGHILCDIEGGFDKYPILSVKRLSDGEIFTVGDKITSSSFSKSSDIDIINNFYIPDEKFCKMWNNRFTINDLIIKTRKSWQSNLCNVIKIKQPLFKTEDGIDIYEGDKFYRINKDLMFWGISGEVTKEYDYKHLSKIGIKHFSTKEAAEKYVLLNKPCLSLNDLVPFFPDTYIPFKKGESSTEDINTQNLEKLVKQKLNYKN